MRNISLFRLYNDIPSGDEPISEEKTIELIRAYAASTSYMDAQVGRVLRQLDTLGLTNNTVLIFLKSTQKSVSINGLSIRGYENAKKCQLICPQYVKNIPYFQYKIE